MGCVSSCHSSRKAVAGQGVAVSPGGYDRGKPDTHDMHGDRKKLVEEALTWLGTPYRYGGQDYDGTDCSGLTMEVYRKALGIKIPRSSREQQKFCKSVSKGALDIGDLVFFCTGRDKTVVSHVGLYVGEGKIVHASGSKGVIISNMGERYYASNYHSSGHVARRSDKDRTAKQKKEKPAILPAPSAPVTEPQRLETDPLRFELNSEVEAKIDSIYAAFLD